MKFSFSKKNSKSRRPESAADTQREEKLINAILSSMGSKSKNNDSQSKKPSKTGLDGVFEFCLYLGFSTERAEQLKGAFPLRDIGQLGVPDKILRENSFHESTHSTEYQKHTQIGFDILNMSESPMTELASKIALTHHEYFCGTGYPNGLKGEDIPLESRIIRVVEDFFILTDRVQGSNKTRNTAIDELLEGSGTKYDPEILAKFIEYQSN